MARPSKYSRELRERAVRMVAEFQSDYQPEFEAIRSIASKLGIGSPETLRKWIRSTEIDGGVRPGKTSEDIVEIKELKKQTAELRGARPPTPVLVDHITVHKDEHGVEPICRVLNAHGIKIAPSTYYDNAARRPSKRALRDTEVVELIDKARANRFVAGFGARKMWLHLRRQGHDVARCTTERLMRAEGLVGAL